MIRSRLDDVLGAVRKLTPDLWRPLTEPSATVADEGQSGRLGIHGVGDVGEIAKRRVPMVWLVHGLRSLSGPYIFYIIGLWEFQVASECRYDE